MTASNADGYAAAAAAQRVLDDPEVWIDSSAGGRVEVPHSLRRLLAEGWRALARERRLIVAERPAELTPAQAAELLGVTRQYVDQLIAREALPVRRLPGSRYRRIPIDAVLDLRPEFLPDRPGPPGERQRPDTEQSAAYPGISGATAPAPTAHGQQRRQRLVQAAAELFGERGYATVSVAEIGAAAGVSGPALYRHFANKSQLLVAVFDGVIDDFLRASADVLAQVDGDANEVLEALVRRHVGLVVRNPGVFAVYGQEWRNLPTDDQRRLRRKQRDYVARWTGVVVGAHPELSERETWARVQVTFGLVNSVAGYRGAMPPDDLADLLTSMALAGLYVRRDTAEADGWALDLPPM